jgi:hypothetical protein
LIFQARAPSAESFAARVWIGPNGDRISGAQLARRWWCFELKWVERVRDSRALTITPAGRRALMEVFQSNTNPHIE